MAILNILKSNVRVSELEAQVADLTKQLEVLTGKSTEDTKMLEEMSEELSNTILDNDKLNTKVSELQSQLKETETKLEETASSVSATANVKVKEIAASIGVNEDLIQDVDNVVTDEQLFMQMNSMPAGAERTKFYNDNKQAIDRGAQAVRLSSIKTI